jgi:cytochrome c oxidase subunit IV
MGNNHDNHKGGHFIVPFPILRNVACALLALTVLTVATAQLHLGWAAAPIAFLIAFIKAMMVMMYFMGLKFDVVINRIIFGLGFLFLSVLYIFVGIDIWTRIIEKNTL